MPLGSLDRTPPPFFKQGTSAFTKLVLFSALSCSLMYVDQHFQVVQPARWALSLLVYPVQWMAQRPQVIWDQANDMLISKQDALSQAQKAQSQLLAQSVQASQVEQLQLENAHLRELMQLRERQATQAMAAEVLYDAADPFTRKMILDKGAMQGVKDSSPVMDAQGVLGQVTRVHPLVSEIKIGRAHV